MLRKERIILIVATFAVVCATVTVIAVVFGKTPNGPLETIGTAIQITDTESVSATEVQTTPPVTTETVTENAELDTEPVTAKEFTNLRAQPDSTAEIVGTLKNGEILLRTAIRDDGWSALEYNGRTVYAVTGYLTADLDYRPTDVPEADVVLGNTFVPQNDEVTAKELTNLRQLPTTDSDIVGTLVSGDFLTRTAVSDKGWSRLEYNGQTVYAVTNYLSTEVVPPYVAPDGFEIVDDEVTAKSQTNLRTAPSVSDSEVVYTLKNGEYICRVAVNPSSGWSRLEYNGRTVYAVTSYLETRSEAH